MEKYENEDSYLESVNNRFEVGEKALFIVIGLVITGCVLYTLNIMTWN